MVAQLAARSCGDLEVTGSNPTIRWETFGLNPQTRSSRISRIPPKVGPDQPVVYTKKREIIGLDWQILFLLFMKGMDNDGRQVISFHLGLRVPRDPSRERTSWMRHNEINAKYP